MTTKLASIISYMFHPLMMSTFLFILLSIASPYTILPIGFTTTGAVVLIILLWVTTFIIPSLSLFILKKTGSISSLSLSNRKERITPLIYTTVMYGVNTYMFSTKVELGVMISVFLGISTLLIALTTLITLFWKISVHGIGIGGLIGLLIPSNLIDNIFHFDIILVVLFILAGIILSARLKLNAHTPTQVYVGFVMGVFVSFVAYTLY